MIEHVHRAELLFGAVQESGERRAVGHVQRQRHGARTQLCRGPLAASRVEVADRHAHPWRTNASAVTRPMPRAAPVIAPSVRRGCGAAWPWCPPLVAARDRVACAKLARLASAASPSWRRVVGLMHAVLQVRGAAARLHRVRRRPRSRDRNRRTRAHGTQRRRRPSATDPAARAAAFPGDAPAAGRRPRGARQPRDHARPARPRRLRAPARHVALLDGHLRRAGGRADGPPADRASGGDGHLARRERRAGGRRPPPGAAAGDGDRDARARQRPAVERADVHAAARRADVR